MGLCEESSTLESRSASGEDGHGVPVVQEVKATRRSGAQFHAKVVFIRQGGSFLLMVRNSNMESTKSAHEAFCSAFEWMLGDPYIVVLGKGQVVSFSRSAAGLLGYDEEAAACVYHISEVIEGGIAGSEGRPYAEFSRRVEISHNVFRSFSSSFGASPAQPLARPVGVVTGSAEEVLAMETHQAEWGHPERRRSVLAAPGSIFSVVGETRKTHQSAVCRKGDGTYEEFGIDVEEMHLKGLERAAAIGAPTTLLSESEDASRYFVVVVKKRFAERDCRFDMELAEGLLATTPNPVLRLDLEGVILSVNSAAERLFLYGEEIVGQHVSALLPAITEADTGSFFKQNLDDVARQDAGGSGAQVLQARQRDGRPLNVRVGLQEVRDEDGELAFYIGDVQVV